MKRENSYLNTHTHPTPVFSSGESHRQRSLAGYRPWGHNRVRHSLATEQPHMGTARAGPDLVHCLSHRHTLVCEVCLYHVWCLRLMWTVHMLSCWVQICLLTHWQSQDNKNVCKWHFSLSCQNTDIFLTEQATFHHTIIWGFIHHFRDQKTHLSSEVQFFDRFVLILYIDLWGLHSFIFTWLYSTLSV